MSITLKFDVGGQSITRRDKLRLAGNSAGFVICDFRFDKSWDGTQYTRYAVFEKMNGTSYSVILEDKGNSVYSCTAAHEALACDPASGGWFYVSVRAVALDSDSVMRATANKCFIELEPNGDEGVNSGAPTPTIPEQVVNALAKSQWLTGTTVTGTGAGISAEVENAAVGCHYLNTETGDFYICTAVNNSTSTWDYVSTLKGAPGERGLPGEPLKQIRSTAMLNSWLQNGFSGYAYCLICSENVVHDGEALELGGVYEGHHGNPSTLSEEPVFSMIGTPGAPGERGLPGADGFSPEVTVTDITGGHRVTITDAEGDHTFDILDGQGGGGGADQSYNPLSTNAQSGKAVAEALETVSIDVYTEEEIDTLWSEVTA